MFPSVAAAFHFIDTTITSPPRLSIPTPLSIQTHHDASVVLQPESTRTSIADRETNPPGA
jgi:hypothetical protein